MAGELIRVRHPVIVVGGGLSGLSATHMILHHGGHVLLLDKKPLLGGNSSRATSGINAALTQTQIKAGIPDSPEIFYQDTLKGARDRVKPDLVRVCFSMNSLSLSLSFFLSFFFLSFLSFLTKKSLFLFLLFFF